MDAPDSAPTGYEWIVAGAIALVVSIGFFSPLYSTWGNWGIADWDVHLTFHAVPRFTILEYGQLPLWNPYTCGGTVLLSNPQSRLLSPFFPLHLIFGFLAGIKLELVAHLAVGLLGAYALGRDVLRSRIGAAMSAAVFMLNSTYTHTLTVGMTVFMCLAYVPWAFLGYVRSERRPLYVWLTGASLTCMFLEGGAYLLSVTLFGLSVFVAAECVQERSLNAAARLLASVVITLGLGAVKFVPTIAFLRLFPRKIDDYSGFSFSGLFRSLFSRSAAASLGGGDDVQGFWHGMSYQNDENGMYVGVLAGVLFLVGVWCKHVRRPAWLSLVISALLVAFGDRLRPSLWHLLHQLPIYDSMRVAQRFRIVMLLGVAIFCGLGAMALTHEVRKRFGFRQARWAGWGLVFFVTSDLVSATYPIMKQAFVVDALLSERRPEPFRQQVGKPREMLAAALRNVGTIDCYEALNIPQTAIPFESPRYLGEVFLQGAGGKVETLSWSPNRLRLEVTSDGPGWVVVNQQGYPGWTVEQGNRVEPMRCSRKDCERNVDGLLAIAVSTGRSLLDVYYRPPGLVLGASTTALFVAAFAASLWAARKR